ncbi:DUF2887 domain-containing protein [Microcystis elabens FACHB-917]|nr:DUF2887 domain-containing protein [Microcystis elabens FACHB-917]
MASDKLFYFLFQSNPDLILRWLQDLPADAGGYRFSAPVLKEREYRLDGLFSPPEQRADLPAGGGAGSTDAGRPRIFSAAVCGIGSVSAAGALAAAVACGGDLSAPGHEFRIPHSGAGVRGAPRAVGGAAAQGWRAAQRTADAGAEPAAATGRSAAERERCAAPAGAERCQSR